MEQTNRYLKQIEDINVEDYFQDEEPPREAEAPAEPVEPVRKKKEPKTPPVKKEERQAQKKVVTGEALVSVKISESVLTRLRIIKDSIKVVTNRSVSFSELILSFIDNDREILNDEVMEIYTVLSKKLRSRG